MEAVQDRVQGVWPQILTSSECLRGLKAKSKWHTLFGKPWESDSNQHRVLEGLKAESMLHTLF